MNPWHDVGLGGDCPEELSAIIEIPKGSQVKYELDKKSGLIKVDRILYSSINYPANYGFIPKTYCDDGDPLDILVFCQVPVAPLSIMKARPVGVMKMVDEGEEDDKIIAVHSDDPEYEDFDTLDDFPPHKMDELRRFFEDYKKLSHKKVSVEEFGDKKTAHRTINAALKLYAKNKSKLRKKS
jgi:inorganic pyrophosphatase